MADIKRYKIGKDFYIRSASGSIRGADKIRRRVRRDGKRARQKAREQMGLESEEADEETPGD